MNQPKRRQTLLAPWQDASAKPFVRIVAERTGLHRLPDPKILAGTNYADVGFEVDARSGRIVALCAIDNFCLLYTSPSPRD